MMITDFYEKTPEKVQGYDVFFGDHVGVFEEGVLSTTTPILFKHPDRLHAVVFNNSKNADLFASLYEEDEEFRDFLNNNGVYIYQRVPKFNRGKNWMKIEVRDRNGQRMFAKHLDNRGWSLQA